MSKTLVIIFVALSLICPNLRAESAATPSSDVFFNHFQEGVKLYQEKKYDKALESFTEALKTSPHNAAALSNLALVQMQLGKKGESIASFRQALSIDPGLSSAQDGLSQVLSQLTVKEIPHKIETYETLREYLISPISLFSYLILAALTLFGGGWLVLSYLGAKKRAEQEEKVSPQFPIIAVFILVVFVFSFSLALLKLYDQTEKRATIIVDKIAVQSTPGEGQPQIFDLYEGLEVLIRQRQNGWAQVSYPGGLSGWVPETSLRETSLK